MLKWRGHGSKSLRSILIIVHDNKTLNVVFKETSNKLRKTKTNSKLINGRTVPVIFTRRWFHPENFKKVYMAVNVLILVVIR